MIFQFMNIGKLRQYESLYFLTAVTVSSHFAFVSVNISQVEWQDRYNHVPFAEHGIGDKQAGVVVQNHVPPFSHKELGQEHSNYISR